MNAGFKICSLSLNSNCETLQNRIARRSALVFVQDFVLLFFKWTVGSPSGETGPHAPGPATMERSQERDCVQIHVRQTVAKTARGQRPKRENACFSSVQV